MLLAFRKKEADAAFSSGNYDRIYFDTCSLLEEGLRGCLRSMIPDLLRNRQKIVIPYPVEQELVYLSGGITSTCCAQARQALLLVHKLVQEGLAEYSGQPECSEQADHYFVKVISSERFRQRIALVTQDRQLMQDINLLNRISSARANPVHTYRLEQGVLARTRP